MLENQGYRNMGENRSRWAYNIGQNLYSKVGVNFCTMLHSVYESIPELMNDIADFSTHAFCLYYDASCKSFFGTERELIRFVST